MSTKITNEKYAGKNIRFYNKGNHYELILADRFTIPGDYGVGDDPNSNLVDVINDLRAADKSKELHIFVESYGGDVSCLNMLLQQVMQFQYRVGINTGSACSCGFMLLMFCHEIYCSPFSEFMYHAMWTVTVGKVSECKNFNKFSERWWKELIDNSFIKRVLTEEELAKGETTEVWLTGAEMIERRLVNDYQYYALRNIPSPSTEFFEVGGRVFKRIGDVYREFKMDKPCKKNNQNEYSWAEVVMLNSQLEPVPVGGDCGNTED